MLLEDHLALSFYEDDGEEDVEEYNEKEEGEDKDEDEDEEGGAYEEDM